MISDRMDILERWVEYFDELLKTQNIGELKVPLTEDDGQILPPLSIEETVHGLFHRLKNHKLPGADGITDELVKYGGDHYQEVHQLMLKTWDSESMPDDIIAPPQT